MPTAKPAPPVPVLPAAIRADAAGIRREIARTRVALDLADNAAAALEGGHANEPLVAAQERRLGLARWLRVVRWLGLASRRGRA